ncbi:hypothetical protein SLEP1_g5978 [Rubroshorea leprosula]|uniref:Essential protein Yae1 N-terminal domain-containing protein n=1 Tax=Rubroshorea leprosula TaxID=152421 RepID=A0AAV5I3C2_9ROSI|nr:hypothetical protein SLEP1_g5978 [Rubroshorea leprosula]
MENSLAEEIYSESFQLSKLQLGHSSTANTPDNLILSGSDEADFHTDDRSWYDSDEESDRELQRVQNQFHTMGYRDGLLAGKDASSQEGFNIGFKQSVVASYNWGLVRGITSAVACLPNGLRESLIKTQDKRTKFQELHESVQSLSTTDALKLFYEDIMTKEALQQSGTSEGSVNVADSLVQSSDSNHLGNYSGELQSLLESSEIKVKLALEK